MPKSTASRINDQGAERVAVYTRVSTDIQAEKEEGSLETQEARLRAYFQARGCPVGTLSVFREEGKSGKSLDRPQFQRLLNDIRAGRVHTVAVTRIDRISRSLRDFMNLHEEFEKLGVKLVSLKENFDTATAFGRAMMKILLVFAELEREQTAERTREAILARAERGLWNGGVTPIGFKCDGHGHLVVVPEEASTVIVIAEKLVELGSTVRVEQWLNENGFRQPTRTTKKGKPRGGGSFNKAAILRLLRSRLYLGEITHRGKVYEGQHDAVIGPELFQEIQEILDRNGANQRKARPDRAKQHYLLTGLIRCACGSALTTSRGKGHPYYRCSKLSKEQAHTCSVKSVRAEQVEAAVVDLIRDASRNPELLRACVAEGNAILQESSSPLRERLGQMKRDFRRVDEEGRTLYDRVKKDGLGDLPWARRELEELAARGRQLQQAIVQTEQEALVQESMKVDPELLAEAVQGLDNAWDDLTPEERKELLRLLVKEVRVTSDRTQVEVDLFQGLALVASMQEEPAANTRVRTKNNPDHRVCDRDHLAPKTRSETNPTTHSHSPPEARFVASSRSR